MSRAVADATVDLAGAGADRRPRPPPATALDVRAKAALPVAGEALVVRILRWLRAPASARVVLNLHHRAETITRIVGDGSRAGPRGALLVGDRGPGLGRRPGARHAAARIRSVPDRQRRHADRTSISRALAVAARRHQRAGHDGGRRCGRAARSWRTRRASSRISNDGSDRQVELGTRGLRTPALPFHRRPGRERGGVRRACPTRHRRRPSTASIPRLIADRRARSRRFAPRRVLRHRHRRATTSTRRSRRAARGQAARSRRDCARRPMRADRHDAVGSRHASARRAPAADCRRRRCRPCRPAPAYSHCSLVMRAMR